MLESGSDVYSLLQKDYVEATRYQGANRVAAGDWLYCFDGAGMNHSSRYAFLGLLALYMPLCHLLVLSTFQNLPLYRLDMMSERLALDMMYYC